MKRAKRGKYIKSKFTIDENGKKIYESRGDKKRRLRREAPIIEVSPDDFYNKLHLVSFSGGKDSTVLVLKALHYARLGIIKNFKIIFCDTGNEAIHTYSFIRYLQKKLNIEIIPIEVDFSPYKNLLLKSDKPLLNEYGNMFKRGKGNAFFNMLLYKKCFPRPVFSRFCTEILKEIPSKMYELELQAQGYDTVLWTGVRHQESPARKDIRLFEAWDFHSLRVLPWYKQRAFELFGDTVLKRKTLSYNPLIELSLDDIWRIHKENNIIPNKIYTKNEGICKRSGCFPCINSNRRERMQILAIPRYRRDVKRWEEFENILSKLTGKELTFFELTREEILKKYQDKYLDDITDDDVMGCENVSTRCELAGDYYGH